MLWLRRHQRAKLHVGKLTVNMLLNQVRNVEKESLLALV